MKETIVVGFAVHEISRLYAIEFPRELVRLGQPVYVEVLPDRSANVYPFPHSKATLHFITSTDAWTRSDDIDPTPELYAEVALEPSYHIRDAVEALMPVVGHRFGWLPKQIILYACVILGSDIRIGKSGLTKEYRNSKLSTVKLVAQRLELCRRLTQQSGWDAIQGHQKSLVYYLLLTCFDLLGQPSPWLPFDRWLRSRKVKVKAEREAVLAKTPENLSTVEQTAFLYDAYLRIYGVKNSFYRFMDDVLPADALDVLLAGIHIFKTTPPDEVPELYSRDEVKKYLYNLRNSYTHRAEWIWGATNNLIPEIDFGDLKEATRVVLTFYEQIHYEDYFVSVATSSWPEGLFQAVEEGLHTVLREALATEDFYG